MPMPTCITGCRRVLADRLYSYANGRTIKNRFSVCHSLCVAKCREYNVSTDFINLRSESFRDKGETWIMGVEDQRGFERKVLHTIYGGVQITDGTWRLRINHELH